MSENPGTPLPKIGSPAERALATLEVTTLEGVTKHTEKELLALHGFGPRGLRILREALAEKGLSLQGE